MEWTLLLVRVIYRSTRSNEYSSDPSTGVSYSDRPGSITPESRLP